MKIDAIVLAAGEGRRMGAPKALLKAGGASFLARACALLARPAISRIIVVLGHQGERVAREAGQPASVQLVFNPTHHEGMLSSILCGLDAAERDDAEAVLLHPVDHPLASPATVDRVVGALEWGARIAVPSHADRRGHPSGFARVVWSELRGASPERGARALLQDHPEWVVHVDGDLGCVTGIDTPEDYLRCFGSPPA